MKKHINIVEHLAPHYTFDIILTNNRETESIFNLYFEGVINYLSDKMEMQEFDNIQIGMVRLIVPDSNLMPSEKELNKIFPIAKSETYNEWELYEAQHQKTIFQWQKITTKIGDLKNINYTTPPKSEARFILFVREASMKDKLGL